jgi:hypothetical protein
MTRRWSVAVLLSAVPAATAAAETRVVNEIAVR